MIMRIPIALALFIGLFSCAAQEPNGLMVQARVSRSIGDLSNVTSGNKLLPGLGLSIMAEFVLEYGWKLRPGIGMDAIKTGASVTHISTEIVKMLNLDQDPPLLGPYLVGGLYLLNWAVKPQNVEGTRRILHLGGSAGFGFRFSRKLDLEIKAMDGQIDPNLLGTVFLACANFRL